MRDGAKTVWVTNSDRVAIRPVIVARWCHVGTVDPRVRARVVRRSQQCHST